MIGLLITWELVFDNFINLAKKIEQIESLRATIPFSGKTIIEIKKKIIK